MKNGIRITGGPEEEMERQRQEAFSYAPLISIVVPVYQAPEEFLRQMLLSVCRQTYKNWELCMAVSDEERHRMEEILEEDVFKGKADSPDRNVVKTEEFLKIQMQR